MSVPRGRGLSPLDRGLSPLDRGLKDDLAGNLERPVAQGLGA